MYIYLNKCVIKNESFIDRINASSSQNTWEPLAKPITMGWCYLGHWDLLQF